MMIKGLGGSATGQLDAMRAQASQKGAETRTGADVAGVPASVSAAGPVARLVAEGAPVDAGKVAAIRAAIAEGRYTVDPQAIAEKMIALDLTPSGN